MEVGLRAGTHAIRGGPGVGGGSGLGPAQPEGALGAGYQAWDPCSRRRFWVGTQSGTHAVGRGLTGVGLRPGTRVAGGGPLVGGSGPRPAWLEGILGTQAWDPSMLTGAHAGGGYPGCIPL